MIASESDFVPDLITHPAADCESSVARFVWLGSVSRSSWIPPAAAFRASHYPARTMKIFVYFQGETEILGFPFSAELAGHCAEAYPQHSQLIEEMDDPTTKLELARMLDENRLTVLKSTLPEKEAHAFMLLLTTRFLVTSQFFMQVHEGVRTDANSIIYTAFRKQSGGYAVRVLGAFQHLELLGSQRIRAEVEAALPRLQQLYSADEIAKDSVYHALLSAGMQATGPS